MPTVPRKGFLPPLAREVRLWGFRRRVNMFPSFLL